MRPGGPFRAGSAPSSGAKARVTIDEAGEGLAAQRGAHGGGSRRDSGLVGDVEDQRHEIAAEFLLQAIGIGLLAHAAKDTKAVGEQHLGAAPADAAGCSGDDDGSHEKGPLKNTRMVHAPKS